MKKTLKWATILILLDMTVGTVIMHFFDVEKFAEQYPNQILLGIFGTGIIWMGLKKYKSLRFVENKTVHIQFLEVQ